jgi:hypothetical protein
MPDQGPAPWVSANDKPSAATAAKGVAGDAAERRLKGDVMQLPARDRRRIKDLAHNDVWHIFCHQSFKEIFTHIIYSMIPMRAFLAFSPRRDDAHQPSLTYLRALPEVSTK